MQLIMCLIMHMLGRVLRPFITAVDHALSYADNDK